MQQWLHERTLMSRYTQTACLVTTYRITLFQWRWK